MFLSLLRTVATIIIATLLAASTFAQQNPRELFERARMLDESNQNLAEAIKLYGQVVSQANEQRALAARAQLRIGMLYERLGRKADAQRAFRTVVNQYSDQTEVAQRARAKLPAANTGKSKIAAAVVATDKASTVLTVRQLWSGDTFGTPSPDGRYLTFVDWDTGDLAIRDFVTEKNRRLTNKGSWNESDEFAEWSVMSPDGKQVAYAWHNKDGSYDLRVIRTDGSQPRVLYRNEEVGYLKPSDWSRDGRHILTVLFRKDNTDQIALISAMDGSARNIKTLGWSHPSKLCLSPDGRWIVYDSPQKEGAPERDIFLVSADGSREMPLVKHPADDLVLGWTPDGKKVLFASDRTGATMSVWAVEVSDGKPQGSPEIIKSDVGRIFPLGFARNGTFYYALMTGMLDIYVASLDAEGDKGFIPSTPVSQRFVGSSLAPAWSPDGKSLAYIFRQNVMFGFSPSSLVIRSLESGVERRISPALAAFYRPDWSPDGGSILVTGRDQRGRQGIYTIDLQTGNTSPLVTGKGFMPRWSADGKAIFYVSRDETKRSDRLLRRDLETEQESELFRAVEQTLVGNLTVSPDGQRMAFLLKKTGAAPSIRLMVMPTAGGVPRELLQFKEIGTIPGGWDGVIEWMADKRQIIFVKRSAGASELWRISAEGGEPQKLGITMNFIQGLRAHPDGKQIAFAAGQFKAEIWAMENFLPAQARKASISRR